MKVWFLGASSCGLLRNCFVGGTTVAEGQGGAAVGVSLSIWRKILCVPFFLVYIKEIGRDFGKYPHSLSC